MYVCSYGVRMISDDSITAFAQSLRLPDLCQPPVGEMLTSIISQELPPQYAKLLSLGNGGYTPDALYHFFGRSGPPVHNIVDWNRRDLWKGYYGMEDNQLVFAEDVVGNQFFVTLGSRRPVVKALWNEEGNVTTVAEDLGDFISGMVTCSEFNATTRELFDRFLVASGKKYTPFHHLSHKKPPCLGGADEDINNLELTDSISNMRFYGQVTAQVKALSEGTRIKDIVIDRQAGTVRLIAE